MHMARLTQLCLAVALVSAGAVAQSQDFDTVTSEPEDIAPERKYPRFFRRPKCKTPAEQLAYARGLEQEGRLGKAARQYNALVHTWHDSAQGVQAQQAFARLQEQRRKYRSAFEQYQYLVDHYAGLFPYGEVIEGQFRIARHMLTARTGGFLFFPGARMPEVALLMFQKVVQNAPDGPSAPEAQFRIGSVHEDQGDFDLAILAYERAQYRYPGTPYAQQAAYRRSFCLYRLAKKSPRDQGVCREALTALAGFARDYPDAPEVAEARLQIRELGERLADMAYEQARFYDRIARRPEAALIAYRDYLKHFPRSEHSDVVRQRVGVLEARGADRGAP
jgi:outer membrane protein assembly factor BamD (BamD/ComL family)